MYQRTDDGQVIDPPVIPEWERRIYAAMESADTAEVQRLTEQYDKERTELADERDERERRADEDQRASDAEAREAVRVRNAPAPAPTPDPPANPDDKQDGGDNE